MPFAVFTAIKVFTATEKSKLVQSLKSKDLSQLTLNESDLIFPLKMYLSFQKVLYFKPLYHSSKDLETSNNERPSTDNTEHLTGR